MTPTQNTFVSFALVLLVGCQLPWSPAPAKPGLEPGQTRIVFQTSGGRSLNLLDADYLTLQMADSEGLQVRFGAASGGGTGVYSLLVDGLTSGDWSLKVRLYPNSVSTNLLFYANLTHYVEAGRSNTIAVDLYPAASITGLSATEAVTATTVNLEAEGAGPWSPLDEHFLSVGQTVQLTAEVLGAGAVPASDQRTAWSSSDETTLEVSSQGLLRARAPGTATLTVTSVEGKKVTRFKVTVNPRVVGLWEATVEGLDGTLSPQATLEVLATDQGSLVARLWTRWREESGPLYAVGGDTFLFRRTEVWTSIDGTSWTASSAGQESVAPILTQAARDVLAWQGDDRSLPSRLYSEWEFRRSSWRLDTVGAPLPGGTRKPAFVGQLRDLDLVSTNWGGSGASLVWSTSDPAVATVSAQGEVAFLNQGPVTIRASVADLPRQTYRVDFEVKEPAAVLLFPQGSLPEGEGEFFRVFADELSGVSGWFVTGRGSFSDATSSAIVARATPTGGWDSAFGGNPGLADADGLSQSGLIQLRNGAKKSLGLAQTGGALTFVTTPSVGWGTSLFRANPQGLLDAGYADDASDQFLTGFLTAGPPVADSQGRIFVVGSREADGRTVVKQVSPLVQDLWVSSMDPTQFQGRQLVVLPDDSFVLVANAASGNEGKMVRILANGTEDPAFGTSGIFAYDNGNGAGNRHYSAVRVVGPHLYLTGWDWIYTSDPRYPWQNTGFVLRLNLDGTFDATFAPGGNENYYASAASPQFVLRPPYRHPSDLAVDSQGRLIVVGTTDQGRAFATRLLPNGSGVDRDWAGVQQFGDGRSLDQGTPAGSVAHSVAIDSAGRIAVAGHVDQTPALWRF